VESWVRVGRGGRPHGLDGSFVVDDASDAPERFAKGAKVYLGREPAVVVAARKAGGRTVVRLDRPAARGAPLEVPAAELPAPEDGSYYVFQLAGLEVVEEGGRVVGRVRDVAEGIANDVLELDTGALLPLVEACVRVIDLDGGRIVVAPGFAGES